MKLTPELFMDSLPIALEGLGITFLVMGVIIAAVCAMRGIFSVIDRKKQKKNGEQAE